MFSIKTYSLMKSFSDDELFEKLKNTSIEDLKKYIKEKLNNEELLHRVEKLSEKAKYKITKKKRDRNSNFSIFTIKSEVYDKKLEKWEEKESTIWFLPENNHLFLIEPQSYLIVRLLRASICCICEKDINLKQENPLFDSKTLIEVVNYGKLNFEKSFEWYRANLMDFNRKKMSFEEINIKSKHLENDKEFDEDYFQNSKGLKAVSFMLKISNTESIKFRIDNYGSIYVYKNSKLPIYIRKLLTIVSGALKRVENHS